MQQRDGDDAGDVALAIVETSFAGLSVSRLERPVPLESNTTKYDESRSLLREGRHVDWLRAPIDKDLRSVPGVGRHSARMMTQAGVTNTYQLIGKFLELRASGDTWKEHCDKFWSWLEEHGTSAGHRHTVTHAIAEKVNTFMPGLYK